jgi:hypothetical protein
MLLMSVPPLPTFYLTANVNLPGVGRCDQSATVFLHEGNVSTEQAKGSSWSGHKDWAKTVQIPGAQPED